MSLHESPSVSYFTWFPIMVLEVNFLLKRLIIAFLLLNLSTIFNSLVMIPKLMTSIYLLVVTNLLTP